MIQDNPSIVAPIFNRLKKGLLSKKTRDLKFRKAQLTNLLTGIKNMESQFDAALKKDMGLSPFLSFVCSTSITMGDIKFTLNNFENWAKKRCVDTSMLVGPGRSYIVPEPYGVVLVLGAWNYPLFTTLPYLATAIAAGNCVIVKSSEMSPHSSNMIAELIKNYLDPDCYAVIEGSTEVAKKLTSLPFDLIIFTGSTEKGKLVAKAAAENLTPVILELGGKSPTIVDHDAHLENAALRIVHGRFMNCGQTCIAPDYVLAHKDIKQKLIDLIIQKVEEFYKSSPKLNPDYPRIVNAGHVNRLKSYLTENHGGRIVCGDIDDIDAEDRFVPPFIVDSPNFDSMMMKDEIFGPILPVCEVSHIDEAIDKINSMPKPLALYYFGSVCSSNKKRIVNETSSGAVLLNGTIFHILSEYLPFGGVGYSGTGAVHGKIGFDQCSHLKPVLEKLPLNSFPLNAPFPPYTNMRQVVLKFLLKYFNFPQKKLTYGLYFLILLVIIITGAKKNWFMQRKNIFSIISQSLSKKQNR